MNNVELANLKMKYYNIGFIIGISPYLLFILLSNDINIKKTFLTIGIITGIVNGIFFKNKILKHKKISD